MRRLAAGTRASARPRFAYPPNLFVVDGGAPQVNAAAAVLDELGVTDVAVIGLAKRLEEVWVPARERRSGDHAAQQRRALPAAAGARRGAPLRDHLSPQQAVEADDRVGTRLGAAGWGSTGARHWSRTSARSRASRRLASRRSPRCRESASPRRRRCWRRSARRAESGTPAAADRQ